MTDDILQALPPSLRLLLNVNQIFTERPTDEWCLGGITNEHWTRSIRLRKRALTRASCEAIVMSLFEVIRSRTGADVKRADDLRAKVRGCAEAFGWSGPTEDFSEDAFRRLLCDLSEKERREPPSGHSAAARSFSLEATVAFYDSFWRPLRGKRIAILGVWAPKSHYDLIPLMLLNKEISSNISKQLDFIYFDTAGRSILPNNPTYYYEALCPVGRPSLYLTCPLLWDAGRTILPSTRFAMPAVTAETSRHLKSPINPGFHSVNNNTGLGQPVYTVQDQIDLPMQRKWRTDYVLIQRLFIPQEEVYLVLLHGCTALGTQVAVSQATFEKFSKVICNTVIRDEDNLEILMRTRGALEWTEDDEACLERGDLLTKPWLGISVQQLFLYINDGLVSSSKEAQRTHLTGSGDIRVGTFNQSGSEALRTEFLRLRQWMEQRYRYASSKYKCLLGEKWEFVRRVVRDELVPAPLGYLELHPSEPCQLNCKFCRGGLRVVPPKEQEQFLSREHLLQAIDDCRALNPRAFIRFSGSIGEPLANPFILEAFCRIRDSGTLRWGLTTNGLLLHKTDIIESLMVAEYVHISLDAGRDETYRKLKGGRQGSATRVLENVKMLAARRNEKHSGLEIVVSLLLQEENYKEIPELSKRLRGSGVNTFEIKMQHFDERRHMKEQAVHEAYHLVQDTKKEDDGVDYKVLAVQSEDAAVNKIRAGAPAIDFRRCYANLLGLNATIDARGNIQTCCQYYQTSAGKEHTIGVQGSLSQGFSTIWNSAERLAVLNRDPRGICSSCSPSDEFINRFVAFLRKADLEDPSFLDWVQKHFVS